MRRVATIAVASVRRDGRLTTLDETWTRDALARRRFLGRLARLGGGGVLLSAASVTCTTARSASAEPTPPTRAERQAFMARAFEMRQRAEAQGDQPYGAVVVKDARIVGEGSSAVVTKADPTAHAEIEAIRDACRRLGTPDLGGCEMYTTSRACPMCEAASSWARISRMYYGHSATDAGAPRLMSC
jgi:tRNA(Arg) A34 adenosine deaminase TadA